jgi:hypothetical protein
MTPQLANELSTYQALRRTVELLAAPIDFGRLVADGVLRARGCWFEVVDLARLPEAARVRIRALRAPNLVKFRKPSKRLARHLKRGW